jgi:hypothetical protein
VTIFIGGFLSFFYCKDFLELCCLSSTAASHTVDTFEQKSGVVPGWRLKQHREGKREEKKCNFTENMPLTTDI